MNNIIELVKDFSKDVSLFIPVKSVILFGSQIKGTAKQHSDIDVAIISDIFVNDSDLDNNLFESKVLPNLDTNKYYKIEAHLLSDIFDPKNVFHNEVLSGYKIF